MGNVVTPLKEQLEAIQKQVTENIKTTTDNKASIEKAIDELLKRTLEIGNDANNLARALKNESKTQGNWGELILEKLLESSGLEEGVHYDRQTTIRDNTGKPVFHDETGKRLIPDVIIHYPDGKDCIIDSKVSLSDYLDYCNAETDDVREQALKRHIISIRKHVKELAGKDYSSYIQPPHQRLNYTIMFVPNEFATQLALQNDRMLWRESFDKGIFITSEQNKLRAFFMLIVPVFIYFACPAYGSKCSVCAVRNTPYVRVSELICIAVLRQIILIDDRIALILYIFNTAVFLLFRNSNALCLKPSALLQRVLAVVSASCIHQKLSAVGKCNCRA